jgi:hypothetical protein
MIKLSSVKERIQYASSLFGADHPLNDMQHGHDERVMGLNCEEWTVEWLTWLLQIPHEKSPLIKLPENPFNLPYENRKSKESYKDEYVLFLASSTYGKDSYQGSNYYVQVPKGKTHIFAAPFVAYASTVEYLGKTESELYAMIKKSVDSYYKIEASLDGMGLAACKIELGPEKDIKIPGIPANNVLGIPPEELRDPLKIMAYGFVIFLTPPPSGLHKFSYTAYAPSYTLQTNIQLNVRGF